MSYPQMSNGHAPTSSSLAKSRFDTLLAKQPPIAEADVAEVFDDLPSIKPGVLIGEWDGHSLDTGHPGHAKLTAMRWAGKTFRGVDDADPIVVLNDAGQRVVGKAWGQSSVSRISLLIQFSSLSPMVRPGIACPTSCIRLRRIF